MDKNIKKNLILLTFACVFAIVTYVFMTMAFDISTKNSATELCSSDFYLSKLSESADINYYSGGNGSEADPYVISNVTDFVMLMNQVNDKTAPDGYFNTYFILSTSIDIGNAAIKPIGDFLYPFKGHFDGKGYGILNANIESTNAYVGVFGAIDVSSSIENLTVKGKITGKSNTGGLVGLNLGTVSNCKNYAEITTNDGFATVNTGGLVGSNRGLIVNSVNFGTVKSSGSNTGGIAGINSRSDIEIGEIRACYNKGVISSQFYVVGGIVGCNESIISQCYNAEEISAVSTAGGITGSNIGIIENVYNISDINVETKIAGGISGNNEGEIYNAFSRANIIAKTLKGGICGFVAGEYQIDSCFFSVDKFNGKLTNQGNNYPNSAALKDVDFASVDTLTSVNRMKFLAQGKGGNYWSQRKYDDKCYMPELKIFSDSEAAKADSKTSVSLDRQEPLDIKLVDESYIYNGTANEPDIYLGESKLIRNFDYEVVFNNNINAGTATARITFINYYKGTQIKTFKIEKRAINVVWSESDFTYNGKEQRPTLTVTEGIVGDDNLVFMYTNGGIDAGIYRVTGNLADNDINSNYSLISQSVEFEIKKAKLQIVWNTDKIIFNGLVQYPTATIVGGLFNNDEIELIFTGYEDNINAGIGYTVTATTKSNSNYFLNDTHTYNIEKKHLSVKFESTEYVYNGQVQYPKIAEVIGNIADDKIEFNYTDYESNILAGTGYGVFAELVDNEINKNYILERQKCTYSIAKRKLTITWSSEELIYNGTAQCPDFSVNNLIGDDDITWKLSDFSGNIDASSGLKYSIEVALEENSNYVFDSEIIKYDIAAMVIYIEWENSILIYNGKVQRPNARVITDTPDEVVLVYSDFNGINAGNGYTIVINSESSNYIVNNVLIYEILPKTLIVIWGENEFVYNGNEQYPDVKVEGVANEDVINIELIKEKSIRIGTYDIELKIDNENYLLDNVKYSYKITIKRISIDGIVAENKIYDGTTDVILSGGYLIGVESEDDIEFLLEAGHAENANTGIWQVEYTVTYTGLNIDCYTVDKPNVFVAIEKATVNIEHLKFESQVFACDGEKKSLFVEGELPDFVKVVYIGNGQIDAGEYLVTARFNILSPNYEAINDLQAKLFIARSVFFDVDSAVRVSMDSGMLPYGTELRIIKSNEWEGDHGQKAVLGVYNISLLNDGYDMQPNSKLKISILIDKSVLSAKNLVLMHVGEYGIEELQFTVDGDTLTFFTNSLSEFVLLADTPSYLIWYVLSGALAGCILISIGLILVIRKKKIIANEDATCICEREKPSVIKKYDKKSVVSVDGPEIPFVLDGVKCADRVSFMAALCYKDKLKQREIARMDADRALAHAQGKGGFNRRDLYWQGKRIIRNSIEYRELLNNADKCIKNNQSDNLS